MTVDHHVDPDLERLPAELAGDGAPVVMLNLNRHRDVATSPTPELSTPFTTGA